MRKLARLICVVAAAVLIGDAGVATATTATNPAAGPNTGPKNRVAQQSTLLSATLAATRTLSIEQLANNGTYGLLILHICVTDANNSVTALGMSCSESVDDNSTDYVLQDISVSAGVGTSVDASWTKDPSALTNKCWSWRVDIEGLEDVECSITNTGGTAADSIVVKGALAVKG